MSHFTRRQFNRWSMLAGTGLVGSTLSQAATNSAFQPKYILASSMYGYMKLDQILPEVKKVGADAIDIWPKSHGDQREQLEAMGETRFAQLLRQNGVKLGCITQYKLGPLGLQDEMKLAKRLGCSTIVAGSVGPHGLKGKELKSAVGAFLEKMKPHLDVAESTGVTIAIENHSSSLIHSPDSIKWLHELRSSKNIAIAFAPYHLPQEIPLLTSLIESLEGGIAMFYAWQHGMGCMQKLPKQQELLQMPGRGDLDFGPILSALAKIKYRGWFEIFMHPVPRGIPILESVDKVTAEINRSRSYLKQLQP